MATALLVAFQLGLNQNCANHNTMQVRIGNRIKILACEQGQPRGYLMANHRNIIRKHLSIFTHFVNITLPECVDDASAFVHASCAGKAAGICAIATSLIAT